MRELRERVLRLELEASSNSKKLDKVVQQSADLHEIMIQIKGARWTVIILAAAAGFVISKAATIAGVLGWAPK